MEAFQTVVNKPSFTPPGIVFGIAWTILYILMAISWYMVDSCKPCVIVYFIQLIVNSLWSFYFLRLGQLFCCPSMDDFVIRSYRVYDTCLL